MTHARTLGAGVGLLLLLTACAGGGRRGAGCVGYADNPHISEPSHTVVAKSRTYCEGVGSVTFTMFLQRKPGEDWTTAASETVTIRNPKDRAKNVRQVVGACVSGTYRHKIEASRIIGASGQPIPVEDAYDYSQEVPINC